MVIGVLRVVLSLPGNDSLKGKRSIVKKILERARARFHVSAAEVGDMDVHRRATLGFAVVSNDARHAESMIDTIMAFVAGATEAIVIDRKSEILRVGAELGVVERTMAEAEADAAAELARMRAARGRAGGAEPEDDDGGD